MSVTSHCRSIGLSVIFFVGDFLSELSVGEWSCYLLYKLFLILFAKKCWTMAYSQI